MLSIALIVAAEPDVAAGQLPNDARITQDVEYSKPNGHSLLLDVFQPAPTGQPAPVIVFVHGGGWKNGSRKSGEKIAGWLVDEGFAVVSVDYRLTDVAQWPAQIDDCYEAVRWVRRNSQKYNFDPHHIAAWGTSAGGHLAALMGTRPCPSKEDVSSRVQAVCNWFGPSDLLTMPPNNVGNGRTEADARKSNGAKLLGVTVKDDIRLAKDASALHHVSSGDSAFLIMHGSKDLGVPIDQSNRLHQALRSAGAESQLHVVEGAGHGGKLFQAPESRQIVRTFFTKHLMNNWPQGCGPNGDYSTNTSPPTAWNLTTGKNIRWRKTLPETGQSTVVVWGKRLFFTTMKEVTEDSTLGSDIVAWCCHADTGETIWTRPISARHPLRLSGCFSDSTAPPAVTDGERVCFFNASGRISCFDFDGKELWTQEQMPVGRSQPFLYDGNLIFTRQKYMPEAGHFTHEHKDAPPEQWTNLQALDIRTGEDVWATTCGVNMGCVPLPRKLKDGRTVILVGRGGGHSPPETPEGVSMVNAEDGRTMWTLPLDGYMSTQTYGIHNDQALIFHKDKHLWVDVNDGRITRETSILKNVAVHSVLLDRIESIKDSGKRNIIQQSNLLVGDYHYFRSYQMPYIGRVHVSTGKVEYQEVPIQTRTKNGSLDLLGDESQLETPIPNNKKDRPFGTGTRISYVAFGLNDVRNSRGFQVMGDNRSQGNGWGHHAAAIPTAAGDYVYMPIMSGMVYGVAGGDFKSNHSATEFNSLGPINQTWTRSSLSFGNNSVYARTIKELICIGKDQNPTK